MHACVSHYSSDDFTVQIVCCFSFDMVAEVIRKVVEWRKPTNNQVRVHSDYCICLFTRFDLPIVDIED